ncbi:head decoration protein [Kocuria salina]|uniref:head decoration protein n=1 Tax=Kocuria salina TaxID=1929416 RepID=UPI001C3DFBF5|nr:head decoration protein [Kocuria salina]
MPKLRSESFGGGDQSWLGSAHGIANCRTETINVSAFTAGTHYPDGYIPSGFPVAKVNGLLVPYNAAGADGSQNIAGHIFTDQAVVGTGNLPAPLLDHGRVKTARVPLAGFAAPASQPNTNIVYL